MASLTSSPPPVLPARVVFVLLSFIIQQILRYSSSGLDISLSIMAFIFHLRKANNKCMSTSNKCYEEREVG